MYKKNDGDPRDQDITMNLLFQSLARKTFSNAVRTARPTMPAFQSFRFMTTGDGEESPTRPTVGDVQLLPRHVSGELDTVGKKNFFSDTCFCIIKYRVSR